MNVQIDLGNLAVGVGTAAVAVVTYWVSTAQAGKLRNQRIAEFRRDWIEDLRSHFAEFRALCFAMGALDGIIGYLEGKEEFDLARQKQSDFQNAVIKLRYEHSYLILMLNPDEPPHQRMLQKLDEMSALAVGNVPKAVLADTDFDSLARMILKHEWTRVRTEI